MQSHYKTIADPAEGIYKEKGSKFIGLAYPMDGVKGVRACMGELKKTYHDARHYCYAYVLGTEGKDQRANDDGEPNHSAGDPILGQILSRQLTNVLVVVVRYFGGTKLGVSGLIQAYRTAAHEALKGAVIIEKKITKPMKLIYTYDDTNEVMRLINDFDLKIVSQKFLEDCHTDVEVGITSLESVKDKVHLMNQLGKQIVLQES